jgi:threonyl-tRNA synthetase
MAESAPTDIIRVTLPDGSVRPFPRGTSIVSVASAIGERLGRATVGGRVNGAPDILDLRTPLQSDVSLEIVTADSTAGLEVIRHSAAHIMADAILRLWPDALLGIGPAIEDGFYYDIDLKHRLSPEDLPRIEEEMRRIIREDTAFEFCPVDRQETLGRAKAEGDLYKAELIESFPEGEAITFYTHGGGTFRDLCRGPHVPSTGYVKAIRLLRIAGAYWRGDEKRPQLQRIYGTAFWSEKDLSAHLERLEEAARRDHRKLGRELGLFMIQHQIAPASPFFLPKGATLYNNLQNYMRELYRRYGYQEVITPQIFDVNLWHTSGHYENYRENMYFTKVEDAECAVKPMNCPGHTFIYSAELRSYRDLPLRIADFGRLHRFERSGVTHGLTRVRTFCQDDAHIFCTPDQIQSEISQLIAMIREVYGVFGFNDLTICLSTRPDNSVGSAHVCHPPPPPLADALNQNGVAYTVNPGDGAFYGPKIDFVVHDALKRPWQLGTVQLDFNLPERFDLTYISAEGKEERPVMIHRAILGSVERFIGILIEHTGGHFPFWVAPVQARVLSINDRHVPYGQTVVRDLEAAGFRVDSDFGNGKTGAKIRDARLARVPFRLVIGDREVESHSVALKENPDQDHGVLAVSDVIALFRDRERNKA